MKIVFVQRIWRELLGPMGLSAVLRARGHATRAVVGDRIEGLLTTVARHEPDVVALSWTADDHRFFGALVTGLRRRVPGARVLAGGPFATHAPELVLAAGPDALCRGEGEGAVLDYVDALERGGDGSDVANLWVRHGAEVIRNPLRPLVAELDALPDPDRSLYDDVALIRTNPQASVMATRGCPFRCTFCATPQQNVLYRGLGPVVRRRSPERVLDEVARLARTRPVRVLRFEDDTFSMDPAWLERLLPRLHERVGLPYVCYVRADQVDDALARLLARTGCRMVCFGVETGDETRRNTLLGKAVRDEHLLAAAATLRSRGVRFYTTNMLGLPGETLADAWRTVELNQRLAPDDVWSSVFQPYPGLPLTEQAVRDGLITRAEVESPTTRPFGGNALRNPDGEAIFNLHKLFLLAVKRPELRPLLERWVRAPTAALNHPIFLGGMAWSYTQHSGVDPVRLLWEGMHWLRFFGSRVA